MRPTYTIGGSRADKRAQRRRSQADRLLCDEAREAHETQRRLREEFYARQEAQAAREAVESS
jgi:hypothetical protein